VSEAVGYKNFDYATYKKPPSMIEKQVQWVRKEEKLILKVLKVALLVLESIALACTIIGIPLVFKGVKMINHLNRVDAFFAQNFDDKGPSIQSPITIKTHTQSFNHVNEYVICNDIIWCRSALAKGEKWRPMYFDADDSSVKPKKISCDGANLIVVDNKGMVHYKKVLKEYRPENVKSKATVHIKDNTEIEGKRYLVIDRSDVPRWKERWFSLPVISRIVNLYTNPKLKIDKEARAVAVAHRGCYASYTEDAVGQKHLTEEGVTTLYVLNADGRTIRKYDPWAPIWSVAEIYLPETSNTYFEAENMSCSASTIMVVGYEINVKTGEKTLKIITRLADIDTEGGNPGLKYGFEKNKEDPSVRVLPVEIDWKTHSLPEGAKITSQITILQTGEGNNSRELRVIGEYHGKTGCFSKSLTDSGWKFIEQPKNQQKYLSETEKCVPNPPKNLVKNFKGTLKGKNVGEVKNVSINSFGKHSIASEVNFECGNKAYSLLLYRRLTLWNFLGVDKKRYDLIIPEEHRQDDEIKKIFGNFASYEVSVKDQKGDLVISSKASGRKHFHFDVKASTVSI
jgi:hypothetical protein